MTGGGRVGVVSKIILMAGLGFLAGCVCAGCNVLPPALSAWYTARREFPLPHHIPKQPGGITLRFAMVHDVLHERYARHGDAYYQERNRLARDELKRELAQRPEQFTRSPRYFDLLDDLAVGLARLQQPE